MKIYKPNLLLRGPLVTGPRTTAPVGKYRLKATDFTLRHLYSREYKTPRQRDSKTIV